MNRHPFRKGAALVAAVVLAGAVALRAEAPLTRHVFVTAADKTGAPVVDLTPADFAVKVGGKTRDIVQAQLATGPLQIAVIVDDSGSGLFRYGVSQFMRRMQGQALMSLRVIEGQMRRVVDYTTDESALQNGILTLGARPGTPDGGQLLAGISESARELRGREAPRPVIIALTVGGEEHSTLPSYVVLDQLRQSGASLHVMAVVNNAIRSTVDVTQARQLLDENFNLSEVLGDGPKQTGGRRDEIVATTGLLTGLQQLGDELLHQYVVSFVVPPGIKPSSRISVSVKRDDVTLRAPTRLPDLD
jgi:hypothetical protein